MSAAVVLKRWPLPASSWIIALRVVAFGALTSNGKRFSSTMRSISRRIASETERPIAASVSEARCLVALSRRARTQVSAVLMASSWSRLSRGCVADQKTRRAENSSTRFGMAALMKPTPEAFATALFVPLNWIALLMALTSVWLKTL